jgi:hypothetical protein
MTTWYGGHGWGWCSMMFNNPATVLLWAAVVAAMVLAVRFAVRRPSNPAAPTGTDYVRPVVRAREAPHRTDNDEFYRRLM